MPAILLYDMILHKPFFSFSLQIAIACGLSSCFKAERVRLSILEPIFTVVGEPLVDNGWKRSTCETTWEVVLYQYEICRRANMEDKLYNSLKRWESQGPVDIEKLRAEIAHKNELSRRRARGRAEKILHEMADGSSKNDR